MSTHNRHFVPGSMAAYGDILWICERTRPIHMCVRDVGKSVRVNFPGVTRGFEPVGYKVRQPYADNSGCWVSSQDGRVHVSSDGMVTPIEDLHDFPKPLEDECWTVTRTGDSTNRYSLIRNNLLQWDVAPIFPKDHVELPSARQLWVTTTREFLSSEPGALDAAGAIRLHRASSDELFGACVLISVDPAPSVGDPIVWALNERNRIRTENASPNLVDVVLEDSFPFTKLIFMFKVNSLPGRVLAQRFALFDRDGGPGMWRGVPSVMSHLRLHIMESGGVERLDRREPDSEGLTWV